MSSADRPAGRGADSGADSPGTSEAVSDSDYHITVDRASAGIGWDRWIASERLTGVEASAPLAGVALVILVLILIASRREEKSSPDDPEQTWREATAATKRRFDEENVTEDDVEDAIEWARSQ